MNDLFFDEEIDSGSICGAGHPLRLVSEGYAYCYGETGMTTLWWPWRLTPGGQTTIWREAWIRSREHKDVRAWVGADCESKQEALDYIQGDIEAYRNLPFNEERERARLMLV